MLFHFTGMRPATPGARRLLLFAGLFNLLAAVLLVVLARGAPTLLGLDPMSLSQRMYLDLFAALVLAFGVAYALGGYDLPRFWPFVAMGVLGKVLVVLIGYGYFFAGGTGALPVTLVTGDAVFAAFFYRVLKSHALAHP